MFYDYILHPISYHTFCIANSKLYFKLCFIDLTLFWNCLQSFFLSTSMHRSGIYGERYVSMCFVSIIFKEKVVFHLGYYNDSTNHACSSIGANVHPT